MSRGRSAPNPSRYNLRIRAARAGLRVANSARSCPDGTAIILAGDRKQDKIGDPFTKAKKVGGAKGDGRSGYQPEFRVEMFEVPYDAPVLVRVHASAIPGKGDTFPRLSFELGSSLLDQERMYSILELTGRG